MVGTKTLICGVWLCGVWISVQPAHADGDGDAAPRTLRMRATSADASHAVRASKRVGQPMAEPPGSDGDGDRDGNAAPIATPGAAPVGVFIVPPVVIVAPPGMSTPGTAQVIPGRPGQAAPTVDDVDSDAADDADTDAADAAGDTTDSLLGRPRRAHRRHRRHDLFTVTGSLIERASVVTPSPVHILRRDDLLAAGRSMIGDVLQPLPEQGNGINAQFNNGGDGSTRINLRSLNIDRTLVLLNGRRVVASGLGADDSVDLNMIPLAVIDRVEILKDAGSTIYGSGAIGGVVNIITRDDFRGTDASLYTAQTERNDGFTVDASLITGHRFADGRGHVMFSAGMQRQEPVFAGDRDFSRQVQVFDFVSGTATPSGSSATPSGRIDARQIDFNGDGRGDPFNLCGTGVQFCTNDGHGGFRPFLTPQDLYNFQPVNYLYTPSSRVNAFTSGTYKLGASTEGFFEASFMNRASQQQLASTPLTTQLFGIVISRDSIYNPFGGDVLSYNRRLDEFGPRRFDQSIDTLRTVAGMRGSTSDDPSSPDAWKWELSFNYGRTDATQKLEGNLVLSRLANAVGPSFIDPSNGPTCGTPAAPIVGCVPMNVLGPAGSISAAAVKYAGFTGVDTGDSIEQMALATAHGRIARLPGGGDVSLAVSAEARMESGDFNPDPLIASGDTTGNVLAAVSGSTKSTEAAAELAIVPVRDRDGLERLEVDLAARTFRYDSFGDGVTSSIRALVRPVPGIALRASRSTSFRPPSIPELFQASATDFPFGVDPCDRAFGGPGNPTVAAECAREGVPVGSTFGTQQQKTITGGNPRLNPETATVTSAGAVLESRRVPGFALSVDFWQIDVAQSIQPLLLQNVFNACYQQGNLSQCDLVHRDPVTHSISFVQLPFFNVGGLSTSGVDVALDFNHHTPAGDLHAQVDVQELRSYQLDTGTGVVINGLGNFDLGVHPRRQASVLAVWSQPHGASAGFNFHFVDSFIECQNNDCNDSSNPSRTVDSYSKLDVFSSIAIGRHPETRVTIGVNNVFDRAPPVIFNGASGNFDPATYDLLGRFAYVRLTQSF